MDSHVKVIKSSLHYLKQAALHINYRPWELAHTFQACFHAPLSYFYCVTSFTSLMLLAIDECSNGSHDCDVNANCTNTNGSHSCTCKEGYSGKGKSCQGKISQTLKKQNNCSSEIIALSSDKLVNICFPLFSYPLRIDCVHSGKMIAMYVILMLTVQTLMVLITASVRNHVLAENFFLYYLLF